MPRSFLPAVATLETVKMPASGKVSSKGEERQDDEQMNQEVGNSSDKNTEHPDDQE